MITKNKKRKSWLSAAELTGVVRDEIYYPVNAENLRAIAARGYRRIRNCGGKEFIDEITPEECREIVDYIISSPELMIALSNKCSDAGAAVIGNGETWDIHIGLTTWVTSFAYMYYLCSRDGTWESDVFQDWKKHINQRLCGPVEAY